ncbi:MAG: bifunctional diaminohydroxyphosphoribosylaminopyrimidine deaminase/5-amino-6-(5-phosphoribosylamino)uracil reductase RibD [Candidatus Eutrophobiaceae bacterium]
MSKAITLAQRGRYTTDPNPRVGCVLSKDGEIIAQGWHQRAGKAHAELAALQEATNQDALSGGCCYVSLEPCSHQGKTAPCADALIAAGISKVVAAMVDPNPLVAGKGIGQLRASGIDVRVGLMEREARALNPGFIKRMECGLPWVRLKMATSIDGRTALANGQSQWITSAEARRDVHRLRAESSALITGIGTVLSDDPQLTVRGLNHDFTPPLRVVFDSHLRTPTTAKILQGNERTLILTCSDNSAKARTLRDAGAVTVCLPEARRGRLDLNSALRYLAEQEQANEILVEAGSTLAGSLLKEGLVDEAIFYMAGVFLGNSARGLLELGDFTRLADCPRMRISDTRTVGSDLRIHAVPN